MEAEEQETEFQKFRCVHDEAYLYINQGITQEKPSIHRKDVALIMYQRGLGLLDQALCFDAEGRSADQVRMQRLQEKMVKTREHVENRIQEITDILAPPLSSSTAPTRPSRPAPTHPPPTATTRPPPPPSSSSSAPILPKSHSAAPVRPAPGDSTSAAPARLSASALPSYREATSAVAKEGALPPTYEESRRTAAQFNVEAALDEIAQEQEDHGSGRLPSSGSSGSLSEQGEVVFSLKDVQIFYIKPCGEVTTPSYPDTLHVIKFVRGTEARGLAPAFIEVGGWSYPLVRGSSPILRSGHGGYMFPDLESGIKGASVGLILPESASDVDREILESLLTELTTSFKTQDDVEEQYKEYKEFSGTLATGLVKGAEVVGKGMVKGAVKTSELLFNGADFAKAYITPSTPKQVDPRLVKGLEAARYVSTGACRVSGWMVSKVGSATMALGRLAAPHLERGATRALTHFSGQSNVESQNQLKIVGEVASGTLAAVSTLYMALENSSKILSKNIANNTVMIVSHKYGTDAAAATDAAFATAGNSYLAFYNAAALGPKGIAKRAAKDAGKAMVGFDPATVNARASRAPDSNIGVADVLESIAYKPKEPNDEK